MGYLASPSFAGLDSLLWIISLFTAAILVMVVSLVVAIVSLLRTQPFRSSIILVNAVFSAAAATVMFWLVSVGLKRWLATTIVIGTVILVVGMVLLTLANLLRSRSVRSAR